MFSKFLHKRMVACRDLIAKYMLPCLIKQDPSQRRVQCGQDASAMDDYGWSFTQ